MRQITIHSGMRGFVMLDRIHDISPRGITAGLRLAKAPLFAGIEALAQAGALHTRFINNFSRHAFLLKVRSCTLPTAPRLDGDFLIRGALTGQSASSCSYNLALEKDGRAVVEGGFLIATVEYDSRFKMDVLETRYRKVFSCLQTGIKPG
ncbi:MAG: hypothetical protein ABFD62_14595 [Syntrophaceae bacterium]